MQVIVIACLAAIASAAPQFNQPGQYTTPIPIVQQSQDGPHPDGSYQYSYATGNGINVEESGYLKNPGTQDEAQVAQGGFSYTAPDGTPIQIKYLADDEGFKVEGAHLPTPPPIPEAIQRALEFLASQPQQQYDEQGFPVQAAQPLRANFG
ncbi:hypothetical protein AAG570_008450 [Ranatra chinensis]|uniref:Uncharacterized protein n=1 Tax=Ranatra chinensis TaxID=642074 RepID=A0ABD0YR19_9HEMI